MKISYYKMAGSLKHHYLNYLNEPFTLSYVYGNIR